MQTYPAMIMEPGRVSALTWECHALLASYQNKEMMKPRPLKPGAVGAAAAAGMHPRTPPQLPPPQPMQPPQPANRGPSSNLSVAEMAAELLERMQRGTFLKSADLAAPMPAAAPLAAPVAPPPGLCGPAAYWVPPAAKPAGPIPAPAPSPAALLTAALSPPPGLCGPAYQAAAAVPYMPSFSYAEAEASPASPKYIEYPVDCGRRRKSNTPTEDVCSTAANEDSCVASSSEEVDEDEGPSGPGPVRTPGQPLTTLMIRNVPVMYTQEMLVEEWPEDGTWDFFYLPRSAAGQTNLSYAFINFVSEARAAAFKAKWQRKRLAHYTARKALNISFAEVQGFEANLEQLKKKRVRRIKLRQCQPIIVKDGLRIELEDALANLCGTPAGKAEPQETATMAFRAPPGLEGPFHMPLRAVGC